MNFFQAPPKKTPQSAFHLFSLFRVWAVDWCQQWICGLAPPKQVPPSPRVFLKWHLWKRWYIAWKHVHMRIMVLESLVFNLIIIHHICFPHGFRFCNILQVRSGYLTIFWWQHPCGLRWVGGRAWVTRFALQQTQHTKNIITKTKQ